MKPMLLVLATMGLGLAAVRGDDAPVTDPAQVAAHLHQVESAPIYQETEEPALNSRFGEWLSDWFKHLGSEFGDFKYASRMPAVESLLMSLLVAFCFAVLLYIMLRLTRRRAHLELEPTGDSAGRSAFRAPEQYDEEISAAVRAGDWQAAWRASWRQLLARLEHRHLVDADRTRTNREYLAQLRAKSLPAPAVALLAGMVDTYDRVIYGRQPIREPDWSSFRQQIGEAVLMLHLDSRRPMPPARGAAT